MILYSQFFITYYTGNSRLSLKTLPENLSSDQRAEYERFIQSISAIYSSQTINGNIPKFWTRLIEGTDALQNTKYSYEPHPDSTLEYLDPKASYYFIVRDESALPLRIPAISGSLLGFTDAKLLPNVVSATIPNIVLTQSQGNSTVVTPTIENLQPYEQYQYEFKSADANWPITFNPISGIIKPATSSTSLKSKVTFCPSSGLDGCGGNAINYQLPTDVYNQKFDKYGIAQISVKPLSYVGPEVLSDQFNITCSNCLPKPVISLSSTSPSLIISSINDALYATYDFDLNIDSLSKNQRYTYNIEFINSQWPAIFIGPSSGIIDVGETTTAQKISNKILLCNSTGICRPGINGVNDYNIPLSIYPKFWSGPVDYDVNVRASITSASYASEYIYSNQLVIKYRYKSGTSTGGSSSINATMHIGCHDSVSTNTGDSSYSPGSPGSSADTQIDTTAPSLANAKMTLSKTRTSSDPFVVGQPVYDTNTVSLTVPTDINLLTTDYILVILENTGQIIATKQVLKDTQIYEDIATINSSDIPAGSVVAKIKRGDKEGISSPGLVLDFGELFDTDTVVPMARPIL